MGILLITVLLLVLLGISIAYTAENGGDWKGNVSFLMSFVFGIAAMVLPLSNACYLDNEPVLIRRYNNAQMLSQTKTDNFQTACYINEQVDRVNRDLKIAKEYMEKNEFLYGIFKKKEFSQYHYIEYNWIGESNND